MLITEVNKLETVTVWYDKQIGGRAQLLLIAQIIEACVAV